MPETFNTQLSALASRASNSATLNEAVAVRTRGNRRIRRRRGGGALFGAATVAVAVSLGVTTTGGSTTPQATAESRTTPPSASAAETSATAGQTSLSSAERAKKSQIQAQLQLAKSFSVGDSRYAVISKGYSYAYDVNFFAGAHSTYVVSTFGATWAQVIAAHLEHGFTNVTTRTESSSTLPTDVVIDIQNSAGVSVLGQRIPLTTPIVLVVAG